MSEYVNANDQTDEELLKFVCDGLNAAVSKEPHKRHHITTINTVDNGDGTIYATPKYSVIYEPLGNHED